MMTPISYCLHTVHPLTPCIHTHMLFFTFLHLALCSCNSEYYIRHLFLLNSSLHKHPFITAHFLHHSTLKQARMMMIFYPKASSLAVLFKILSKSVSITKCILKMYFNYFCQLLWPSSPK